jgi:hypothetical protein
MGSVHNSWRRQSAGTIGDDNLLNEPARPDIEVRAPAIIVCYTVCVDV